MLKNQSILCISSIDWDFIWQGHQQIMSTLAAEGNRVLFLENTGVRRPNFRDVPRLRQRIRNWWSSTKGFREQEKNLFIYSPLVLPFPYSRVARLINRSIIVRAVSRWMKALGIQRPLVWTFLPTPLAMDVIRGVDPDIVVYYCIDDFESSSAGARAIRRSEDRLLQTADLVFVTSEKLRERAARFRENVEVFPFAVDYRRFEMVRLTDPEVPEAIGELDRPVVGYIGGLHRFVDQELVAETARLLPDVSFAFIGPRQCDLSILEAEPNIHLLGPRNHSDLPAHIQAFDVGLVPYEFDPYTENVYPTKLNEYLAMGVPVVATGLAEIVRFNTTFENVVGIANTPDAFAAKIREAIDVRTDPDGIEQRIRVARQNSWDARISGMSALINEELAEKRNRRESWDTTLRRIYRTSRSRLIKGFAFILALYLIFFQSPLPWLAADPLRVSDTPTTADAIVVFAGGAGESGEAGGGYQERVRHAVDLYRGGYASEIIFSSGFIFEFPEAEVMKNVAVGLGIPADSITLEQAAGSTYENVVFSREILRQRGMRRILLVSSPYHMLRSLLTWHEQAPDIEAIASPVPRSQFYSRGRGTSFEQLRGIVWEYAAIVVYWLRGWI